MKKEMHERNDEIMKMAAYNRQHNKNIQEMQDYIESFKQLEGVKAKRVAKESLIRSGVLNKNGTVKKKICR